MDGSIGEAMIRDASDSRGVAGAAGGADKVTLFGED